MSKNLFEFKKYISASIITPLLVMLALISSIFYWVIEQNNAQIKLEEKRHIQSTGRLYQSQLSEKLAISASSNIFLDFITAGTVTRKELLPKFLEQLNSLRLSGITGLTIYNIENKETFEYGEKTQESITLELCYLSNKLDNIYGNCGYNLKLYLSKKNIIEYLKKINDSIYTCKNCDPINLFQDKNLGSFKKIYQSPFLAYLSIYNNNKKSFFYYYIFLIISLIIFASITIIRVWQVINKIIANPLKNLVSNIKHHTPRKISKNALQELNYLIQQIDYWEEQLEKSKHIEKQAAIGQLAAKLTHDIQSPLAVMDMVLNNKLDDENIFFLKEASKNIRNITRNLLENYRISTDKNGDYSLETKSEIFLLYPMINSLISQKKIEWQKNSCEIKFIFDKTNTQIRDSKDLLQRVISNLLNNAYESLNINNRIITLKLRNRKNYIELGISDNGCGIEENKIIQVLNGTSLKHKGEGLGLSSAKTHMENLGGNLILSSKINKGTTIILQFPHISL